LIKIASIFYRYISFLFRVFQTYRTVIGYITKELIQHLGYPLIAIVDQQRSEGDIHIGTFVFPHASSDSAGTAAFAG